MNSFSADWWSGQPLNEIELAILTIEITAADPLERSVVVEAQLGWTRAYYEENVRCLLTDGRARDLAPGLVDVLAQRYPGPPSLRSWDDDEAFTRLEHL